MCITPNKKGEEIVPEDLAASFQASVVEVLVEKTRRALEAYPVKQFVLAGGVAANKGLRTAMTQMMEEHYPAVIFPSRHCLFAGIMRR